MSLATACQKLRNMLIFFFPGESYKGVVWAVGRELWSLTEFLKGRPPSGKFQLPGPVVEGAWVAQPQALAAIACQIAGYSWQISWAFHSGGLLAVRGLGRQLVMTRSKVQWDLSWRGMCVQKLCLDGEFVTVLCKARYYRTWRAQCDLSVASGVVLYFRCPSESPSLPSWGIWSPKGPAPFLSYSVDWGTKAWPPHPHPHRSYSIVVPAYWCPRVCLGGGEGVVSGLLSGY